MSKYIVTTKEVHAYEFLVDAKNKEEAISLVSKGEGEEIYSDKDCGLYSTPSAGFSYQYSLETDLWDVNIVGKEAK